LGLCLASLGEQFIGLKKGKKKLAVLGAKAPVKENFLRNKKV
jgi:hypothetical protein